MCGLGTIATIAFSVYNFLICSIPMGLFSPRKSDPPPAPEEQPSPPLEQAVDPLQHKGETASSLPPLVLKTLVRSDTPLPSNIRQIVAWKDFNIVVTPERVSVYDEHGEEVKDFLPIGSTNVNIQWLVIAKRLGKTFITEHGMTDVSQINLKNLPFYLQSIGQKATWSTTSSRFDMTDDKLMRESLEGSISVIEEGKYIVLFDPRTLMFIAFQTQKDGQTLPPRNWIRIDAGWKEDIPPDLLAYLTELHKGTEQKARFQAINDTFVARVSSTELTLLEKEHLDGKPVFSDRVQNIGTNMCTDPHHPALVYYCRTENPTEIIALDTSGPPPWSSHRAHLQSPFPRMENLQIHPNGKFFLCFVDKKLVVLARDTLEMVEVPDEAQRSHIIVDTEGRIRSIDAQYQLVIEETNLDAIGKEMDKRKVAALAKGIDVHTLFQAETSSTTAKGPAPEDFSHLALLQTQYTPEFTRRIWGVRQMEDLAPIQKAADTLKASLRSRGLRQEQIAFITKDIDALVQAKTREFADKNVQQMIGKVRNRLAAGISLLTATEIRQQLETMRSMQNAVAPEVRSTISALSEEFEQESTDLFRMRGGEIEREIDALIERESKLLQGMEQKREFDEWYEFTLPQLKRSLAEHASSCPAECQQTFEKITDARRKLQKLADAYAERFEKQREQIREGAASRTEQMVATLKEEIRRFIERLQSRSFGSRAAAEQFIQESPAQKELEAEIAILANRNEDAAKELSRTLKVSIAQYLYEVERSGARITAADGREMEMFGATAFPKFEAHVQKKGTKAASLQFLANDRTQGVGVQASQIMGDMGMLITAPDGQKETVRLWEGMPDEDEYRLGSMQYQGKPIAPSYLPQTEYLKVKTLYREWKQGKLKEEYATKRDALRSCYAERETIGKRTQGDSAWKQRYKALLEAFAEFSAVNHIPLLRRLEQMEHAENPLSENGKGFVPEWQNHWVVAPEDERNLEEMAKRFKMQTELQEGIVNLKGHAGTGKDVLMKIFACRTRRPYFAIDCSKWTTEFELSEDIQLEAENGASKTVKVPSVVLTAIQTPGAIMYFNEINAMPEQAQIFLHALMDEKRALTLKTSSGKVVKAHPSVLLASSMNPGYPGTFDPQMATRSRMIALEVNYPPLHRQKDFTDTNPNPPYSVSEPLKIARSVDSLSEATMDPDMQRNPFVQWWDYYVNRIGENPNISATQEFDINVILALVQFAHTLRLEFIQHFEKTRASRNKNALPVTQPITLREMLRCAYFLSQMTPEEKMAANSERVAKDLIETFFLSQIDSTEDRAKIKGAMDTWTSQRRLSA